MTVVLLEGGGERRREREKSVVVESCLHTHFSRYCQSWDTERESYLTRSSSFAEDTAESRIRTWKKKLESSVCAPTSTTTYLNGQIVAPSKEK